MSSNEQRLVDQAITLYRRHSTISSLEAKVIASRNHGGQTSAMYSLASTGAIDYDRVLSEIHQDKAMFAVQGDQRSRDELAALEVYVHLCGSRGPLEGWEHFHW